MELQAMRAGRAPRDETAIDRMFASRVASADSAGSERETLRRLQEIVSDFEGIRDVSTVARRAAALARDTRVRERLDGERDDERREQTILREVEAMASRLASDDRLAALNQLGQKWMELSAQAESPADSTERQLARRVLGGLSADGTTDADYARIIARYRMRRPQ
jgi:hypothetical protein